jgi:hypothetical protein
MMMNFFNFIYEFDFILLSETWQHKPGGFDLEGYQSIFVPRPDSLYGTSKRGQGGVCLHFNISLKDGVQIMDINNNGVIWIKLLKTFFGNNDIYLCFMYIPTRSSV